MVGEGKQCKSMEQKPMRRKLWIVLAVIAALTAARAGVRMATGGEFDLVKMESRLK
jgi:hypothetical protein